MANDDDHVAAMAARLPPVRYYVPYEEQVKEVPVPGPDSPQSPGQQVLDDFDFPPIVLVNPLRGQPLVKHAMDDVPPPPAPRSEPPAEPAAWDRPWPQEDDDLYYVADKDDPESMLKALEVQSKRFAVLALRHFNTDPSNGGVNYELVQATSSNGIMLDSGHIIGHVTFTARAATGHEADPQPFFAEVREPDTVPSCIISMDHGEEPSDDDLCQFCGDALKHPRVPTELLKRPKGSIMGRVTGLSATNANMNCGP